MMSHLTRLILVSATLAAAGLAGTTATRPSGVAACAAGAWSELLGTPAHAGRCAP